MNQPSREERRKGIRGHLVLIFVQFLFASFPVAGKQAFDGYEPLAVAGWRVVVGAAVLMLLARLLRPGAWRSEGDLPRLALLALFGVTLNQLLFIHGLERSTAVTASFMMGVIPVATYGLALLFRQETLGGFKVAGLLVALVGATLLVSARAHTGEFSEGTLAGNLMLLGNALSYSLFLVLAKPVLARRASLTVTAWTFLLAVPMVLPFTFMTDWLPADASGRATASLAWILIGPTVTSYLLVSWALGRLRASVIGSYVYLQPLIGAVLAITILGERVVPAQIGGGAAVLLGIWLVSRRVRDGERRP